MQDDPFFDADETLEDPVIDAVRETPRYELIERLGAGGMAAVYRARQRTVCGFERVVALKRILPERAADPSFVDWFIREAKIVSALSHPNIVQIYDFGRDDHGYFIAMEHLEGRSLEELVRRAAKVGERAPIDVVLAIARELCDALDHVHNRRDVDGRPLQIIHRDVSFANLFVTTSGHVKLIDFGIAASRNAPWKRTMLVGKLSYMAPEAVLGAELDGRVDVFAAGVVLWQLLCGCPLFSDAHDATLMDKVVNGEIHPPSLLRPKCPPSLDAIVLAMLARDRDRRPDAAALRAMIDELVEARPHAASAAHVARWFACVIGGTRSARAEISRPQPSEPAIVVARPSQPTVSTWQPMSPLWQPRRRTTSFATRAAVVACIVGGWFAVSAFAKRPDPQAPAATTLVATTAPQPNDARAANVAPDANDPGDTAVNHVATPTRVDTSGRRLEKSSRRASRRAAPVTSSTVVPKLARDTRDIDARDTPAPALPPPAPPPVVLPLEPTPPTLARPHRARSMIPPDRVRQLSGRMADLDLRRIEREGVARRIIAVLCIDRAGKVSGVRYLGDVPAWAQQTLTPSLRAFSFTPYIVDHVAVDACFTRDLTIAPDR